MDVTFLTDEGRFNYRTAAIIIHEHKLLAMRDRGQPYHYLPGGRVRMNETANEALMREIREELSIDARIVRPLWVNESFFTEEVDGERYHEVCLYFLVDVKETGLFDLGDAFTLSEGSKTHDFRWIDFNDIKNEYIYPLFLKERIWDIPETLEMLTTFE